MNEGNGNCNGASSYEIVQVVVIVGAPQSTHVDVRMIYGQGLWKDGFE